MRRPRRITPVAPPEAPARPIRTERLDLVAGTAELIRSAIEDPPRVGSLLGVIVPAGWPGDDLRDVLPIFQRQIDRDPVSAPWGMRIMVLRQERTIVGDLGFKGRPDRRGRVEVGYGVLPAYRRQGLAVEAARGLIGWAFAHDGVREVLAECLQDNLASIAVLEHLGMHRTGRAGRGDEMLTWALRREDATGAPTRRP